jgi:hypothetical protein
MYFRLVVLVISRNASEGRSLSIESTCRVSSSARYVTRDERAHERGAAQKCLTKICPKHIERPGVPSDDQPNGPE